MDPSDPHAAHPMAGPSCVHGVDAARDPRVSDCSAVKDGGGQWRVGQHAVRRVIWRAARLDFKLKRSEVQVGSCLVPVERGTGLEMSALDADAQIDVELHSGCRVINQHSDDVTMNVMRGISINVQIDPEIERLSIISRC